MFLKHLDFSSWIFWRFPRFLLLPPPLGFGWKRLETRPPLRPPPAWAVAAAARCCGWRWNRRRRCQACGCLATTNQPTKQTNKQRNKETQNFGFWGLRFKKSLGFTQFRWVLVTLRMKKQERNLSVMGFEKRIGQMTFEFFQICSKQLQ